MSLNDHYTLLKQQPIDELSATFYLYEHRATGAKLFHLKNDDPENVFCLSLSTYPQASHGVAHILEHMALCGSKKYPVKDPFFSMIRRSLNTFMNAFTGSDFTCYPAASQNETDFYNLLDVYIDAVFFPHLDERSFAQEGHRLEWKNPTEYKELLRAGIVYNEMKGAYVNPDTHLWKRLHEQLLCDTCYRYDSGGDPRHIPELTHEALCDFHRTYYHPSHCLFFFYGNLDTQKHADFLHQRLLSTCQRAPELEKRKNQPRWKAPRSFHATYPGNQDSDSEEGEEDSDSSNKPMAAISWLTGSIQDTRSTLLLELLEYLLMGHDGAPLKRFFLESGVCRHAFSSVENDMLEIPFSLIFKDCQLSTLEELRESTLKQLQKIYQEGFSKESIESALHQLKLSRLEISGGGYPFGLTLFFRAGLTMQQGADPIDALKLHEHFDELKHLPEDPSELLNIFKTLILENPHRLDLWLTPDPQWAERAMEEEQKKLQALEASLLQDEKAFIRKQADTLKIEQEKLEDKELLPKIDIASIHRYSQDFPLDSEEAFKVHDCFTNGFVYVDSYLHLKPEFSSSLSSDQWHELKLLAYLWPRLGTQNHPYEKCLELLDLHSSGLGTSFHLTNRMAERSCGEKAIASLVFSISGLSEKTGDFLPLMQEAILTLRFDEIPRIQQLIETLHSSLQNQIPSQALQYAISHSTASINPYCGFIDWVSGLDFVHFVAKVNEKMKLDPQALIGRLQTLKEKLLDSCVGAFILSGKKSDCERAKAQLQAFAQRWSIPNSMDDLLFILPKAKGSDSQAYEINSQVNFNALSLPGPHLSDPEAVALRLGCELIKQQVLHAEIREKGGAYGYGCSWSTDKQAIIFHSYRDPHIKRTLEVFKEGAERIGQGKFTQDELDEAKRCWIQKLDKPLSPGERASASYGWQLAKLDLELRNNLRKELLDCKADQIASSLQKWIVVAWPQHRVCLFGPAKQIEQETSYQPYNPVKSK